MEAQKEVGIGIIGDSDAVGKRQRAVGFAREDDFGLRHYLVQTIGEDQRQLQREVFFVNARNPDGALVGAAVPGVNHNRADCRHDERFWLCWLH